MLLAGDVGGTKTNLALFAVTQGPRCPVAEATISSQKHASLSELVREFLAEIQLPVEHASFGVAGPVVRGQAQITNLPWVISEKTLQAELGIPSVCLLNDLESIAYAVPFLGPEDIHTLNAGSPDPQGNLAVIAPGTGLGEAFLTWDGSRYIPHASEGGHADFAPTTPLEIDLLRYFLQRLDHVSYERVCSGLGIPNIYHFLKDTGRAEEPDWLAEQFRSAEDPTPLIVTMALDPNPPEICRITIETFVHILGSEAGNLALKILATGGVFLGGGIPPRILPALEKPAFLQAFQNKGRFSGLMSTIPLHIIRNPKAALLGASYHAWDRFRKGPIAP